MSRRFLSPVNLLHLTSDPASGSDGDIYFNTTDNVIKVYYSSAWNAITTGGGGGGTGITVSITAPSSPSTGDAWYKNDTGEFYIYDGTYWVEVNGTIQQATSIVKHQVKLGESISKGQAVYVSSANGTNMIVSKASNSSESTSSKTMGLLETGGVLNDQVNVITEGLLTGVDTSTANSEGDPVWLGTSGNVIFGLSNKPYAPSHLVFLGIVTRKHAVNGEIFVKVQNGFELEELHNVGIGYDATIADNEILAYDTTSGLWINQTAVEAGLIDTSATEQTKAGNLIIGGNLTVNGTTTTLNTADLYIEDNIITLNSGLTGTPSLNAGIEVERGTSDNVSIIWDESEDRWKLTGDGTNFYALAVQNGWTNTGAISITSNDGVDTGNISLNSYGNQISLSDSNGVLLKTGASTKIFAFNNDGTITFPDISIQSTAFLGISSYDTDDISEGSTNKYFTDERAQDAIGNSLGTGLSYNDSTGAISNSGVTSISGTTNEISVSASTGSIIIGIPDSPVLTTPDIGVATATSINGTTIPSSSTLVVSSDLSSYLTTSTAASTYLTQSNAASTYQPIGSYLTSETDPIFVASEAYNITSTDTSHWDAAYGWGDHSLSGYLKSSTAASTYQPIGSYLTSYTETDPIYIASSWYTTTNNSSNWDTAYGWGNHATVGYLTSYTETQTLNDVTTLGGTTSNAISITKATGSSSTTTGAFTVTGGVGIGENLYVGGNLDITGDFTVHGTTTTVETSNLEVTDPLIYIATGNSANINDIGIVGHFDNGTYQHTGLVRDASDGKWKLFSAVTTEPSSVIDFTGATYDTLKIGTLEASSIPTVGTITSGTWNGSAIGYSYGGTGLTSLGTAGQVLKVNSTGDGLEWGTGGGGSSFSDSAGLAALLSDETGTGYVVFSDSPTFTGTVSGITKSMVGLGSVENTALSTWTGSSNITTLGTIGTGTWQGSVIADSYINDALTISGGTVNNTPIGATTPSTGKFTSVDIDGVTQIDTATTTISAVTATAIFTDTTAYSTIEYTIQAKVGSNYRSSKIMLVCNGTTTTSFTEYAILENSTNSIPVTFTATASSGVVTLNGAFTGWTAGNNITVKVVRTGIV